MRKLYTIFFLCLITVFSLQAQHFLFTPTDTYEGYQSVDVYMNHIVYMENLTGDELILSWETITFDIPWEWSVTTCDYGGCFTGIPAGNTMLPISDTLKGFLKITVNPDGYAGTGTALFKVWDFKYPEQCDTVSFTMHAGTFTGVGDNLSAKQIQAYPNPASDWITVENINSQSSVKLINHLGQIVLEQEIKSSDNIRLDIKKFTPGIYFLISENASGILQKEKIIIQ